jgi:hypothetical protein
LRQLTRISTAFSHTRHLKVFSNICRFALERKGEILVEVDSTKIADLIEKTFSKKYEETMIQDYLLTAEAFNLITHISKTGYGLTDYGLSIAAIQSDDEFKSISLTNFERYLYFQLIVRKDYDYLLALLRSLTKAREDSKIINSVLLKSRCPSLLNIRNYFQEELVRIVSGLNLGLNGSKLMLKMEKMKGRTLNHRLSSLIFWLVEIIVGASLFKPQPDLLGCYGTDFYTEALSRLEESLEKLDLNRPLDLIVDERFPELFSNIFKLNSRLPNEEDLSAIASRIVDMLKQEWDKFAILQPYQLGKRIPALPFLILIQSRFLHENMFVLSFSDIMNIFRSQIESFGYILTWRYDFHSGYIEKIT